MEGRDAGLPNARKLQRSEREGGARTLFPGSALDLGFQGVDLVLHSLRIGGVGVGQEIQLRVAHLIVVVPDLFLQQPQVVITYAGFFRKV